MKSLRTSRRAVRDGAPHLPHQIPPPAPTSRGFLRADFRDAYGAACSIQESSNVDPHLWLGCDGGLHHRCLPSGAFIPGEVISDEDGERGFTCSSRMHLTREMAAELIPMLRHFVETGGLPEAPASDPKAASNPRPETGPMQFPDDWPGVFVRGDHARWLAFRARTQAHLSSDEVAAQILREVADLMSSCEITNEPRCTLAQRLPAPAPEARHG